MPTVDEFITYLDNPVTVGFITECLKEEYRIIPCFNEELPIAFTELQVTKDPYSKVIKESIYSTKKKKVGRNEKCPCGSSLK